MKSLIDRRRCFALLVVSTGWLRADPISLPKPASPPLTGPLPLVEAFARERELPLNGIELDAESASARVGDEVIALITLFKTGRIEQWLGRFRLVDPNPDERSAKEAEAIVYSSVGNKHIFKSAMSAIEMQLFGPFRSAALPGSVVATKEQSARVLVRSDYLALGLERWHGDVMARNEAHSRYLPNNYSGAPFSDENIRQTSAIAKEVGFTFETDRAVAGAGLALGEFLSIAERTPGLREIVEEIVAHPSLWSFLNFRRIGAGFGWSNRGKIVTRFDPKVWGWPPMVIFRGEHRLFLNGDVAANIAFFVTTPRPPLLTCAGIIGLTVEPPVPSDRRLELRVLAARRGPAK